MRKADETSSTVSIQCLCGAVEVELRGPPSAQYFCHCGDCQAVHGAAYVPLAMYPSHAVNVTRGNPVSWALRVTPRTTCRECGTRLFAEVPHIGIRAISAVLLPVGAFEPTFHMQCHDALRPVSDDLPHFVALPPAFGGSPETVAW